MILPSQKFLERLCVVPCSYYCLYRCVGTLTTTVLSVVNIVVLLAFSLIVYFLAFIFWGLDGIYRKVNGIFGACPIVEKNIIYQYMCVAIVVKNIKS